MTVNQLRNLIFLVSFGAGFLAFIGASTPVQEGALLIVLLGLVGLIFLRHSPPKQPSAPRSGIDLDYWPEPILIEDPKGYVAHLSAKACDLLSVAPPQGNSLLRIEDAFGSLHSLTDDPDAAHQVISSLQDAKELSYQERLFLKDGRVLERKTHPLTKASGRLWIIRNVTEAEALSDEQRMKQSMEEDEAARITDLAEQLYLAKSELEEKQAELTRLANTDSMTGLYNRRRFMERAGSFVTSDEGQHSIEQSRCWALMFDLDRFKRINDTLGHAAGDEALKRFAAVLASIASDDITPARLGGEEFAVLSISQTEQQVLTLAEKIRAQTQALQIEHEGKPFNITVSIGVAGLATGNHPVEHALNQADIALYQSKTTGRNKVALYNSDTHDDAISAVATP